MKATFEIKNPEELEATIKITATVKTFKELRKKIDTESWPELELSRVLSDVIFQAEKHFYVDYYNEQTRPNRE